MPPDWFHEGQRKLWAENVLDLVACAGSQGGKTCIEPYWLLREIQRSAPLIRMVGEGKFLFVGPTLTLLRAQALGHFERLFSTNLGLGTLIHSPKPVFHFSPEGLRRTLGFSDCPVSVHFAYAKDPNNLESMTALAGVWDEAGQDENRRESYDAFNRRLTVARSTPFAAMAERFGPDPAADKKGDPRLAWWFERFHADEGPDATFGHRLWGTTPYEWGWFKNEVVDKADPPDGSQPSAGFRFVNWPSWMNPHVTEEACRKELEDGQELWRWEMMRLGRFTKPAGIIYSTFDFNVDTCDDFTIPPSWPVRPGVDFGSANMAAVLVAEDAATQTLYVVREYLKGNETRQGHADGIRGNYSLMPGAGGSHQEDGSRDAFRLSGLALDEPPTNDVAVQISCVYAEFAKHKLIVFRSCKGLTAEIQNYSYALDADGVATDEIQNKRIYHRLDALRYIVTKLRPPKGPDKPAYTPRFAAASGWSARKPL